MMKLPWRTQCIQQVDYRSKHPDKQDAGCFVATIRHAVESEFERPFTMQEWSRMWSRCVKEGAIEGYGLVNDHEWTGNIALDIIGKWKDGYRFHYVAIQNPDGTKHRLFKPEYQNKNLHLGVVWTTQNGMHMNYSHVGHNEVLWETYPGLKLLGVQSIRQYYIGRTA